jgi:primary-amine oxidase
MTRMLAQPDGWVAQRSSFPKKALWVVPEVEGPKGSRMWPAGKFVPGSRLEPDDSVSKWAQGDESIEDKDIVLFITVGQWHCGSSAYGISHRLCFSGTTHIPRPEDWPV